MRFIQKIIVKNDLKKIEKELKNVRICMLYWSHGEMGFTQSKEEIEELEKQEYDLIEKEMFVIIT